jgi:CRISPR-associated endonuclease Cas1
MAASSTLSQENVYRKSPISRTGVLTLTGFGIKIRMHSGHLEIEDGVGMERRKIRLARVGHGLKRLVCISEDGFVTLSALRWLADIGASLVMLNRNGRVLFVTGPNAPSDVRLRRAQALAHSSGAALRIARELIDKKLAGQEGVARYKLLASENADAILRYRSELAEANTIENVRLIESQAASAYWAAWHTLPINFPRKDEPRTPAHWRVFGARVSTLTGSPRAAVNPANAMLNLLYCLLESESRLAAVALGLDPGMGVLHVDTKARDSLACDLMEPVRPEVDAFLFDWITREPLKRDWFFEQRDGNCRLISSLAVRLSETAPMWGRAVAPHAEMVARMLWTPTTRRDELLGPPTRLTQRHKREAKDASPLPSPIPPPRRENLCHGCGKTIRQGRANCAECAIGGATERLARAARLGRVAARNAESRAKHSVSRRRHAQACSAWDASSQPGWLTAKLYSEKIQPLLAQASSSAIAKQIGVSRWYAGRIRQGYRPHPRHWQALAEMTNAKQDF